jgi:hypothetical protein
MPYFMLFKIALSGYEERAVNLISHGLKWLHVSVREGLRVGLQPNGHANVHQEVKRIAPYLHLDHSHLEAQ